MPNFAETFYFFFFNLQGNFSNPLSDPKYLKRVIRVGLAKMSGPVMKLLAPQSALNPAVSLGWWQVNGSFLWLSIPPFLVWHRPRSQSQTPQSALAGGRSMILSTPLAGILVQEKRVCSH